MWKKEDLLWSLPLYSNLISIKYFDIKYSRINHFTKWSSPIFFLNAPFPFQYLVTLKEETFQKMSILQIKKGVESLTLVSEKTDWPLFLSRNFHNSTRNLTIQYAQYDRKYDVEEKNDKKNAKKNVWNWNQKPGGKRRWRCHRRLACVFFVMWVILVKIVPGLKVGRPSNNSNAPRPTLIGRGVDLDWHPRLVITKGEWSNLNLFKEITGCVNEIEVPSNCKWSFV